MKQPYSALRELSLVLLITVVLGMAGCSSSTGQQAAPASSGGPIKWSNTAIISRDNNPAWGRMLLHDKRGDNLITYTEYPGVGTPTIRVARSNAAGTAWTIIASIPSPTDDGGHIQEQSQMVQLPDGTILMAMRNHQVDYNWFGLPIMKSVDGGSTWALVSELDTNPNANGQSDRGLWEPFLYVLPNGCVAGFYANEKHADDNPAYSQVISERISCDEGQTWGPEIYAASESGGARPGMPGFARMANGQYILVFEVCATDSCNIHYKLSPDGKTWTDDVGTPIANQQSGPYVTVLSTGRILVTSANTELISVSDDNGASWYLQNPPAWETLDTGTWPAIYQTDKHEVGVISNIDNVLKIKYGTF